MESEISEIFKLYWAYMPLSPEEMNRIPENHRIRPYLVCMEDENSFYGFPCTSNIFQNKERYVNSRAIIEYSGYNPTLVKLDTIYKLPKENIKGFFHHIHKGDDNEIIKKIQANFEFSNYPQEVVDYFEGMNTHIGWCDVIMYNDQLYNVVGIIGKKFILIPIYRYPVNNTVECNFDGLKYYADVDKIIFLQNDGYFKYCTYTCELKYGRNVKTKEEVKELGEYYFSLPRVQCNCDYSKLSDVEPGMILDYFEEDIMHKLIVLTKNESELEVLIGGEHDIYATFEYKKIPINTDMLFIVSGVLSDDRFIKLRAKKLEEKGPILKLYNNNLQKY